MHTFSETGPGVPAFLAKLWRLVEDPGTDNLISWSPDGKSFVIQNQAQFARELLPLNYKHNNMASFIRQLNMYGFHKITSIDNGGLKFDRDDMEFSHSFFQRGYPYLLEHIKRKIAHPKSTEEKSTIKPETVNKVLTEVSSKVKIMRGRQDSLDTRFTAMKQENEALWREIAVLRQKHMKQQQIVNKLIQFLVTIVQPQRTGLSGMGGKRRYQLMINDIPQSSKLRRTDDEDGDDDDGPIIHEMGEDLLDECDSDSELAMNFTEPLIENYTETTANNPESNSETNEEAIMDAIKTQNTQTESTEQQNLNYLTQYNDEINFDDTENVLTTPMVKRAMEKTINSKKHRSSKIQKNGKSLLKNKQRIKKENKNNSIKIENSYNIDNYQDKIETNQTPLETNENEIEDQYITNIKREKTPMYTHSEDFMNAEMPSDIFDDDDSIQSQPDQSPMLGGVNLNQNTFNNTNIPANQAEINNSDMQSNIPPENIGEGSTTTLENNKDWALSTTMKEPEGHMMKLNSAVDIDNHLESFQGELDSLKDLLRGEGLSVDANTLLGDQNGRNTTSPKIITPSAIDFEHYLKLFSDSDILAPYGLSMTEKKQDEFNYPSYGSELMTYQPNINCDLSELLDEETLPQNTSIAISKTPVSPSVLNTPIPEKDFTPYKTKKF